MKAVAYMMLDIEIWKEFAKGNNGEYAIGCPTIEMFMDSYSQKYNVDYRAKAVNPVGYQISRNGGKNWTTGFTQAFNVNDSLYVLPQSAGTQAMWIASPSSRDGWSVIYVNCYGWMDRGWPKDVYFGFRPIVCLKSDAMLKKVEGGYEIE